jgi:hypothetical protein
MIISNFINFHQDIHFQKRKTSLNFIHMKLILNKFDLKIFFFSKSQVFMKIINLVKFNIFIFEKLK